MFFSKPKESKTNEEPKWSITEQFLKDNFHNKQYPISDLLFAKHHEKSNIEVTVWYETNYLCNLTIPESDNHIFTRFSLKECADFIPSFEGVTTEGLSGDKIEVSNESITMRRGNFGLAGIRTQEIDDGYEVLFYGKAITEVSSEVAKQIELAKHVYLSRKYGLPHSELKKEYQNKLSAKKERERLASVNQELVMLTTETNPNIKVTKRLDVITAECAYGMNVFKDIFASFSDTFGGRSGSIQNTLRDARKVVLDELRKEALAIGANAVIAVDLDYSEISGGGKSGMLFLVASGTAVVIDNG